MTRAHATRTRTASPTQMIYCPHGRDEIKRRRETRMTFQNFTFDIDADGIALVTWNMPGRSMNVIDEKVTEELAAIAERVATEDAIKGAVLTSGKDAFCGGADLTMLETLKPHLHRIDQVARRGSCEQAAVRGKPQAFADRSPYGDVWQAVGRGHQRHRDGRRLRAGARLPSSRRCRERQDAAWPAGNQSRPVSRRRRDATHRAHAAAGGRAAISAQGRSASAQSRQGDEACRRGRAASRSRTDGKGLD